MEPISGELPSKMVLRVLKEAGLNVRTAANASLAKFDALVARFDAAFEAK